jgi:hypothetical protein
MAGSYHINAIQGDHLQLTLRVRDVNSNSLNLSGYDVRGEVRYSYGYTGASGILLDLNPVIYSGVGGSYYSSGIININIDSFTMAKIPVGIFVYDIERFPESMPTGNSIKLLKGKFIVSPEATINN